MHWEITILPIIDHFLQQITSYTEIDLTDKTSAELSSYRSLMEQCDTSNTSEITPQQPNNTLDIDYFSRNHSFGSTSFYQ